MKVGRLAVNGPAKNTATPVSRSRCHVRCSFYLTRSLWQACQNCSRRKKSGASWTQRTCSCGRWRCSASMADSASRIAAGCRCQLWTWTTPSSTSPGRKRACRDAVRSGLKPGPRSAKRWRNGRCRRRRRTPGWCFW